MSKESLNFFIVIGTDLRSAVTLSKYVFSDIIEMLFSKTTKI